MERQNVYPKNLANSKIRCNALSVVIFRKHKIVSLVVLLSVADNDEDDNCEW